jgi:hypothetical protein
MPTISKSAGLSMRYTNHSLRSTMVHILDSTCNQFAGRHITSSTGHKLETSLKTYTSIVTNRCIGVPVNRTFSLTGPLKKKRLHVWFKCLLYIKKDLTGHRGSSENIKKNQCSVDPDLIHSGMRSLFMFVGYCLLQKKEWIWGKSSTPCKLKTVLLFIKKS